MSDYAKVAYVSDSSDMSRVNDALSSGPDPQYMIDYDVCPLANQLYLLGLVGLHCLTL